MAENNSPGYIETTASSKKKSKEKLRINQLIPGEILDSAGETGIKQLLEKYYEFMNINEFIYDDAETHTDVILDNKASFRILDPKNENNQFYTDEQGSSSTLKIISQEGVIPAEFNLDSTSSGINDTNITVTELQAAGLPIGTSVIYGVTSVSDNIGGLTNALTYYVVGQNTTSIQLSLTPGGDPISLTPSNSATHTLKGTTNEILYPIDTTNIQISGGNNLPGSLAARTSDTGKTMSIIGLEAFNGFTAELTTPITNWVGPGPSYVLNSIEDAMDIDKNSQSTTDSTNQYLEMIQREIAGSIPRKLADQGANLVSKNTLYKRIVDFYKIRGSSDSIETFFRLLFGESVEIEKPYDNTLIPSAGDWDSTTGQFISKKGFISEKKNRIHDSFRYQKFSYLIKSGLNITDWNYTFNRLVHPAGFIFFGEIQILREMTRRALGTNTRNATQEMQNLSTGQFVVQGPKDTNETQRLDPSLITDKDVFFAYGDTNRELWSSMPGIQPGVIGAEDLPLLVEMFAYMFGPSPKATIFKKAILSAIITDGNITGVNIVEPGAGYPSTPAVVVSSSSGADAEVSVEIGALGEIVNVTVDDQGDGNYVGAELILPTPQSGGNSVGQIASIDIGQLANKTYRIPPIITIGAPTALDEDGNLLSTNVNATAEFTVEPTGVQSILTTYGGLLYTTPPKIIFSAPQVTYTRAPLYTEDFENASVSNSNWDSWRRRGTPVEQSSTGNAVTHTASIETIDSSEVLKIQTDGGLDNSPLGDIGGIVAKLTQYAPHEAQLTQGNTVKVKFKAKKPVSGGAGTMQAAYSTNEHGSSSWQTFTLTTDWQDFEFEYDISASQITNEDYIGFQGDGSDGIAYIDNVSVEIKYDYPIAHSTINNGKVNGIAVNYAGSGYNKPPTITFSGGTTIYGDLATAEAQLVPSEINGINITNPGNGYVVDPVVKISSTMEQEQRASLLNKLIIFLNHEMEEGNNYFNSKKNSYYNSSKRFDFNQTFEQFGHQRIDSNHINTINKQNVNSFIHIGQ